MSNIDLLREKAAKRKRIKDGITNFLFVMTLICVVASIFLGIWWEPFPFWKAFGTEIIVLIILLII